MALDSSGNPVISYYDRFNRDLKLVHCGNATCTSGNTIQTVDSTGDVGEHTSLALDSSGNPVISYYDSSNFDLKLVTCGNATCSSGNTIQTVDSTGDVGWYTALALDSSGNPVISYYDITNIDLKLVTCGNATCSSGNTIQTLDSASNVGWFTALALDSSGKPVISYYDITNSYLKLAHCGNANCTSGNTIQTVDSAGPIGVDTSLALDSSGNPVISYYDVSNRDLKLVHCGNANCTSGNTIQTVDSTGDVGGDTSLALDSSGRPVISYLDNANGDLKLAHCGNANCTSGNTIQTLDSDGFVGGDTALALDSSGRPVISYFDDTNGDLKLARLVDVDSTPPSVTLNQASGQADPTSTNPVLFTADFSEAVTGFTGADVTLSGTANRSGATVTVNGGPSNYTISVAGLAGNGTLIVALGANVATDAAGNGNLAGTSTDNTVTVNFDSTGPVITPNVGGTLGSNGWYVSDVTVNWTVVDNESTVSSQSGCETQNVTSDTAAPSGPPTFTCSATSAGGSSSQSVTVKRDATPPTISVAATTQPNANGWYNGNVTVQFTCADALSGLAPNACPTDQVLSSEGSAVASTAQTVTDLAGNTSAPSNVVTVKIDKTAPVVTVTGVSHGADYPLGSVPTAGCSTSDALSGVATQATLSVTGGGGPLGANGTGSFTATCSGATDLAGNSAASVSVNYTVNPPPDSSGPVITSQVVGTQGNNSWYTSDVTVSWGVVDAESAITSQNGCDPVTVNADTAGVTFTCAATSAGGSSSESVIIKRDATAPTISAAASSSPNPNGWYNSNVTVHFTCNDNLSGVGSCPADQTLSSEGSAVSATAQTITDLAGNSSAPSNIVTVQIDKTAPVVAVTGVSDGGIYTLGSVPTAGCDTSDALAGVATQATLSVTGGNSSGTGVFTATCSGATDNVGNSTVGISVTYTVQPGQIVFYLSSAGKGMVGGVSYQDEDILRYSPATGWSLFFDGSDVGVANTDLDAFHLLDDGSILMSFEQAFNLPPLGPVAPFDIIRFTPRQLGSNTVGSFSRYFDGRSVGLEAGNENIDALALDAAGNLVISTVGTVRIPGVTGRDEDLLTFVATSLGDNTAGTWALLLDGSAVDLTAASEDVGGLWIDPVQGNHYLATKGKFLATGTQNSVGGDGDDLFGCTPLGNSCRFFTFFDGDLVGFKQSIDGVSLDLQGNSLTFASLLTTGSEAADAVVQFSLLPDPPVEPDAEFNAFDQPVEEAVETDDLLNQLFLPLVTR